MLCLRTSRTIIPHISGYHLIMGRSDIYKRGKKKKKRQEGWSVIRLPPPGCRARTGAVTMGHEYLRRPPSPSPSYRPPPLGGRRGDSSRIPDDEDEDALLPLSADAPTAQTAAADAASSVIANPSGQEPRVPSPLLIPFFSYSLPP